jgi:DNA-binding NarL/FixJ family response regulator
MPQRCHPSIDAVTSTSVFIVTDVLLYREALRDLLRRHSDIDVVGVAANLRDDFEALAELQPRVVVVDAPPSHALDVTSAVRNVAPLASVIVVGVRDDETDVLAWAEAGVSGYVTRDESLETLVSVVRAAARDELVCSPRLAATLLRRVATLARPPDGSQHGRRLTEREQEVLGLLGCGLSNKEIAHRLSIALPTAKNHVHNILDKLEAQGRCELVARVRGLQGTS